MRVIGDLEGCWVVLGVMRNDGGSCLFNGDPRRSKKDHRGFPGVLEGAEETWGVTF